ncbi:MAG: hypothetical protein KC912_24710 [Proteobacteria bacterium]|nr:hypothetical protein [Pseudomonadota bacterium]
MLVFLLTLWACEGPVPPSCDAMCVEAADLYGGCLDDWGLDWTAAGYDDERAFLGSCETWAWEADLVTRDQPDWLETTCDARSASFASPDATCDDYTSVDWNDMGESSP